MSRRMLRAALLVVALHAQTPPPASGPAEPSPPACADDATWHKKDDETKNCQWVSELLPTRCEVHGDSQTAQEACRKTCDTCESELPPPRRSTFAPGVSGSSGRTSAPWRCPTARAATSRQSLKGSACRRPWGASPLRSSRAAARSCKNIPRNLSHLEQRHRRHAHRLNLVREKLLRDFLNDGVHGERLVDDGRADDLLHAEGHVDEFEALGPLEPAARCVCVVRLDGVDAALTDAIDAARASTA